MFWAMKATKDRPAKHASALVKQFLLTPWQVGTWTPSSRRVAEAMVEDLGLEQSRAVCELGAGTGPITAEIVARMPQGSRFFAVELSALMAETLRENLPDVKVHVDDAFRIEELCREEKMEGLDAVIASVPWLFFPPEKQQELLTKIHRVLRPGGRFAMLTHRALWMPGFPPFRKRMEATFGNVRMMRRVRLGLVPVTIFHAVR